MKLSALAALKNPMEIRRRISYLSWRHTRKPGALLCPLCPHLGPVLPQDLVPHIARHMESFKSALCSCKSCNISFVHYQDLQYHDMGTCGFHFKHLITCTGHHATGSDRSGFKDRLRNWELAQLQRFRRFCDLASSKFRKPVASDMTEGEQYDSEYNWEVLPKPGASHTVPNFRSTMFDGALACTSSLRSTRSSEGLRAPVDVFAENMRRSVSLQAPVPLTRQRVVRQSLTTCA